MITVKDFLAMLGNEDVKAVDVFVSEKSTAFLGRKDPYSLKGAYSQEEEARKDGRTYSYTYDVQTQQDFLCPDPSLFHECVQNIVRFIRASAMWETHPNPVKAFDHLVKLFLDEYKYGLGASAVFVAVKHAMLIATAEEVLDELENIFNKCREACKGEPRA